MYKQIKRSTNDTLNDLLDVFLTKKRLSGLSERTLSGYSEILEQFVEYANSEGELNEQIFLTYIQFLQHLGRTPSSINHHISAIRVFLYYLMEEGELKRFKINLIKQQEPTFKIYTDDELSRLVEKPSRSASYADCRAYAMICLIMATGARASTVLNIHKEDLDFENKQINFRHMKTRQALVVPMANSLVPILKEFILSWEISSDFLFPDVTGNQLSYNALRCSFDRYCEKRNVTPKGVHSLRHSFARNWVINNGNLFQLQRILGHSTLDMTRKYVRLFADDLKEDYENYSLLDTISKPKGWAVRRCSR